MTRSLAGLTVGLGLVSAALATAAPPTIKGTTPFGVQRGAGTDAFDPQRGITTEVTIEGANLKGTLELVTSFPVMHPTAPTRNEDATHWKTRITPKPDTPLGVYPIWVRTEEGISNPMLFSIGQLEAVAEKEDNSTVDTAQVIPGLCVVEGQAGGNDVDYFRFTGKKGERIVLDALCARIGSGVDPSIRLTTVGGAYVASADDTPGLLTDARLWATLPEDTDYLVEISDSRYQGGGRPIYRLLVGPIPIAEEVYPLGGRRGESVAFELRGGTLPDATGTGNGAPPNLVAGARLDPGPSSVTDHLRATVPYAGRFLLPAPVLDVESLAPALVSELPELREPVEPDAAPLRAAVPVALNGRIDPAGDEDRFVLAVTPGQKLRIEVDASEYGSALDGTLQILDAKGAVLANADDTAPPSPGKGKKAPPIASPDPSLDFTVPAGQNEVTLAFKDLQGRGGIGFAYRIRVEPASNGFDLVLDDTQVNIPRGGTAAIGVSVVRKGYNGPITLTVPGPHEGLTVQPGTIAEGQLVGSLTLTAAPEAPLSVTQLQVVGQGPAPGQGQGQGQGTEPPISARARKTIAFATQTVLTTCKMTQVGVYAAIGRPAAIVLKGPETPVEVAHGAGGTVPFKIVRSTGADAALNVTSLPLATGLALAETKIAEKKDEANVVVNAAPEAPLGTYTIALLATGKLGGSDQTFAAPEITLNVVRPATIELADPSVEVKAGEPAEVKGKITRKGTFKEEVTVKLNKLPAGLKAEPVKLAPDQTEFTLKIEAEPKAAATAAKAELALVFQVAKKDYPLPPATLAIKVIAAP
jgi:hypothetical protein